MLGAQEPPERSSQGMKVSWSIVVDAEEMAKGECSRSKKASKMLTMD
jgi:hypothetical protein